VLNEPKTYLQQINEAGIDVVLQPVGPVELVMVEPTEGQLFWRSRALYRGHERDASVLDHTGRLAGLGASRQAPWKQAGIHLLCQMH
jgi:hypothetical protein